MFNAYHLIRPHLETNHRAARVRRVVATVLPFPRGQVRQADTGVTHARMAASSSGHAPGFDGGDSDDSDSSDNACICPPGKFDRRCGPCCRRRGVKRLRDESDSGYSSPHPTSEPGESTPAMPTTSGSSEGPTTVDSGAGDQAPTPARDKEDVSEPSPVSQLMANLADHLQSPPPGGAPAAAAEASNEAGASNDAGASDEAGPSNEAGPSSEAGQTATQQEAPTSPLEGGGHSLRARQAVGEETDERKNRVAVDLRTP